MSLPRLSRRISLSLLGGFFFLGPLLPADPAFYVPDQSAPANTLPMTDVMLKLRNTVGHENDPLIQDIAQNSGNYAPPVFLVLAGLLYRQGQRDAALFWYHAGRLRANFDALRCADPNSCSDVAQLVQIFVPEALRKSQFNHPARLRAVTAEVIRWDETTPHNYEYRWLDFQGAGFTRPTLEPASAPAPLPLHPVPPSGWAALAHQNRAEYLRGEIQAVALRRPATLPPQTTSSATPNTPSLTLRQPQS
jgi:hypothetical protein